MNDETIARVARHLGWAPGKTDLRSIEGGFTGAKKYLLTNLATTSRVFLKVLPTDADPVELEILHYEAKMYDLLDDIGLVGKIYPKYYGQVSTPSDFILILDELSSATWGGPWPTRNIHLAAETLRELHATKLSDDQRRSLDKLWKEILGFVLANASGAINKADEPRLLAKVWQPTGATFVNSRSDEYYRATFADLGDFVQAMAARFNEIGNDLLATDLNFGNIAFTPSRMWLVDPVYVKFGRAALDRTALGISILREIGESSDEANLDYVYETFLDDMNALCFITRYWVSCSGLDFASNSSSWMDFQQSCAVTALAAIERLRTRV